MSPGRLSLRPALIFTHIFGWTLGRVAQTSCLSNSAAFHVGLDEKRRQAAACGGPFIRASAVPHARPVSSPACGVGDAHIGMTESADSCPACPVLVAAGILTNGNSILICQRRRHDPYGLQWEFPGGKVEPGEQLKEALRRELCEELAIEAEIGEEVFRLQHRYPDRYVEVVFFFVHSFRGAVQNRVFEAVEWAPRKRLRYYSFLEADRSLVERIAQGEIV
jgi:8-oxo-dGTP diphosphatase